MDGSETSPLLGSDHEVDEKEEREKEERGKENFDLKNVVLFHGKELAKSFIRDPSNLVRVGVGREGVFKVDSEIDKVLKHWKYSDIKDWSYSGFSFTLQLRSGGTYHIRTDEGESICNFIEAFQKDPDKALDWALDHPPNSKYPESGIGTLRRKFSAEQPYVPMESFKFYTLDRRTSKKTSKGPTTRLAPNVDVDSRLRGMYPRARGGDIKRRDLRTGTSKDGPKRNGVGSNKKKQHAKEILTHKLEEAVENEKRRSNGILMSPVSTKGEVTKDSPTQPEAGTGKAEKTAEKKMASKTLDSSSNLQQPSNEPHSSTKDDSPSWQIGGSSIKHREPSSSSGSESVASNDTAPLLRPESSASSGPFSPTDSEFQFIPQGQCEENPPLVAQDHVKKRRSLSCSSSDESRYDHLDRIRDEFTRKNSSERIPRSDLERSGSSSPGEDHFKYSRICSPPGSPLSPLYDHLPTLTQALEKRQEKPTRMKSPPRTDLLTAPFDIRSRRNISQPCLSTPVSARESPSLETSPSPVIMEHDETEEDETPVNSDDNQKLDETSSSPPKNEPSDQFPGVVLRPKKKHLSDPFADILGSPMGVSKLRWSQEMNPLYDYIKGVRITEGMASQGIRLYDTAAEEEKKERRGKTPTTIPEEDLEQLQSEGEVATSPKGNHRGNTTAPSVVVEYPKGPKVHKMEESPEMSRMAAATCTLPRTGRVPHLYEDISLLMTELPQGERPVSNIEGEKKKPLGITRTSSDKEGKKQELKSATLSSQSVVQRRLRTCDSKSYSVSPRLGKRILQQRRSRTISSMDDTETVKRKQKPIKAADNMKDFSYVMREWRLFFIKMPNGKVHREVFNINKPVFELREKLCDVLGVDNPENYHLYVEGAALTTIREGDLGTDSSQSRMTRSTSLAHLVDNQSLPDQGTDPKLLKSNLSLRMQGISTTRILSLVSDETARLHVSYSYEMSSTTSTEEFHKNWVSIVQGNLPCAQEDAITLAALQYQAYFLDRTAVHSVVGFCRPTEFLPVEFSGVRGIEQRMYTEQENLKNRTHQEIQEAYSAHCAKLTTYDAIFFPAREPRKKLLQSMKLKPILLGVSSKGILRIDPKTKEVLDMWDFQVLKNWAYSRKTFVLAFTNKNYPVESNQAKWISELVDFHVNSIMNSETALSQVIPGSSEEETSESTSTSP